MLTSVINPRVVLIVRLICHDENVYEEIIFCKASQYKKVNCIFLHKITGLAQNLPKSNKIKQPFYQEEIKPMGLAWLEAIVCNSG